MLIDSTRRIFFSSLIAAGGLASLAAMAQGAYPNRPVTLVVAYAADGANDVAARTIAQELGAMWSQSVVVEAVKDRLSGLGMEQAFTSADAFRQLIATGVDKYAAVINAAGLKAE